MINSLQIVMNTERYEAFPGAQDPFVTLYLQPFKSNRDRDKIQTTQSILINPSRRYDIAIFGTEEVKEPLWTYETPESLWISAIPYEHPESRNSKIPYETPESLMNLQNNLWNPAIPYETPKYIMKLRNPLWISRIPYEPSESWNSRSPLLHNPYEPPESFMNLRIPLGNSGKTLQSFMNLQNPLWTATIP